MTSDNDDNDYAVLAGSLIFVCLFVYLFVRVFLRKEILLLTSISLG